MKKILITLMTVLVLTAFTACESKDVETAEETTASIAEEITAEAESEITTETITEAETTTEKETEAETEPEAAEDKEIFKGTGYTLKIDSEKWLDYTEYIDRIARLTENTDLAKNLNVTAENIKNMSDAVYYHSTNGSNFNLTVTELGEEIDDETLTELAVLIQDSYNSMQGYACDSYELIEVNGYRALKIVVTADAPPSGTAMKQNAYLFYPGTKQIGVTFAAAVSNFDEAVVDFEEVLNSISFE